MSELAAHHAAADRRMSRARLRLLAVPALLLAYLLYVFLAFEGPRLIREADGENGRVLLADTVGHKVQVTRDNRSGEVEVAVEGERKGR